MLTESYNASVYLKLSYWWEGALEILGIRIDLSPQRQVVSLSQ